MVAKSVGYRVERALAAAGMSQHGLADATGLSQSTVSRIISGARVAKMPELLSIAWATGTPVAELTGLGSVADRAQCAARATNGSAMDEMRQALLHFLELDAYLEDQAVPAAP
jgi:transcriptional regulator with XRE-family HTH domain